MSVFACVSETAVFTFGAVQALRRFPFDAGVFFYDHLRDTVAIVDSEIVFPEVYENNAYLTSVVGVDGARRIDNGYSVIQSQSGTRSYLAFVAGGELHVESGGYESPLHRTQSYGTLREESPDVHARRLESAVCWKRVVAFVYNLHYDSCRILKIVAAHIKITDSHCFC